MNTTTYVVSIGNSGSGKTTFLKDLTCLLRQNYQVDYVSADELRKELTGNFRDHRQEDRVWHVVDDHIARTRADYCLIDVTNARSDDRKDLVHRCKQRGTVLGLYFPVDLQLCWERQATRSDVVPWEAIERMHKLLSYAPPNFEEGFDELFVVS